MQLPKHLTAVHELHNQNELLRRVAAKVIICNAKFLVLATKFLVFNTKFFVLNTISIILLTRSQRAARYSDG